MVYIHTGKLFGHKKERNPIICDNKGKPRRHCTPAQSRSHFRQDCWRGLSFPLPGDLPHPGTETASLAPPALAGRFSTTKPPKNPQKTSC